MWRYVRPRAGKWLDDTYLRVYFDRYLRILAGGEAPLLQHAKAFAVQFNPEAELEELLEIHEEAKPAFRERVETHAFPERNSPKQNYLQLKACLIHKLASPCQICHRLCSADRDNDELGWCRVGTTSSAVASAFAHTGEEPPLIPSGTVFFHSCTLRCVFCQNSDISQNFEQDHRWSRKLNAKELVRVWDKLESEGTRNINLVGGDPTPHLPQILDAMLHYEGRLPFLWNSNFMLTEKAMTIIVDLFDLWLPDFKFGNDECAAELSSANHYMETLHRNLTMMDKEGFGNAMIRCLAMPGHLECCSFPIMEWLADKMPHLVVNLMFQFRPEYQVLRDPKFASIRRRLTKEEIQELCDKADSLRLHWRTVSLS